MSRLGGLLDDVPMGVADRRVRAPLDWQVRGFARGMALAVTVAGSLLLVPSLAGAAPRNSKPARGAAPAAAAPAAPSASATPPRVSPYAIAARQHAQATSGAAHAPAVPPTMRRTRKPIGQRVR